MLIDNGALALFCLLRVVSLINNSMPHPKTDFEQTESTTRRPNPSPRYPKYLILQNQIFWSRRPIIQPKRPKSALNLVNASSVARPK